VDAVDPERHPTCQVSKRSESANEMKRFLPAVCLSIALALPLRVSAQVNQSGYVLPMSMALDAAKAAVAACAAQGYAVNAFVVDSAGLVIVQLRGDHATVHTKDSAYRKAYTIVSMGPIFDFDRTSGFVSLIQKAPNGAGPALANLPNILALPGGVAIKHGSEIVAGLGVGGAPGGDRDEACAVSGVAAIAAEVK
jgi:uncharacterized protein GlcG (DUF336 family)